MRVTALVRPVAVLVAGIFLLWLSIGVTATYTVSRFSPAAAMSIWPQGAASRVGVAIEVLKQGGTDLPPERRAYASALTRDAALREPISSDALATYAALKGSARVDELRRLFGLTERLSRRNTIAQLWLIEDAVAREDISGAILHYDRLMRYSPEMRKVTLPVLVAASGDPAIRNALVPVLKQRPLWSTDFMAQLATSGTDPFAIETLIRALKPDPSQEMQRRVLELALRRLLTLKGYQQAAALANFLEDKPGSMRGVTNGTFENPHGILPFAWWYRDEGSIRAYQDMVQSGSQGLVVSVASDGPVNVTQQLVGLAPGRYVFSGKVGGVAGEARPYFEPLCVDGKKLDRLVLPVSSNAGAPFRFTLEIPNAGCALQWLNLWTPASDGAQFWLDDIAISPAT